MKYVFTIRDIEPIRVAYMKYRGVVTEANRVFPNVFKSVMGKTNGAGFFSYHSIDPETKVGEIDLCVPTAEIPVGSGVDVKEMPRIRALCVTHTGSYATLVQAYEEITRYAFEHGLKLGVPYREVYIKGPGMLLKGNPKTYITEIQFPVIEECACM